MCGRGITQFLPSRQLRRKHPDITFYVKEFDSLVLRPGNEHTFSRDRHSQYPTDEELIEVLKAANII